MCNLILLCPLDCSIINFYHQKPIQCHLTLSQTSPGFYMSCSTNLLKTLQEKEKLLERSNFSFSPWCCLSVWRTFCHFHQLWNCCLQTISVWKSLTYVVWERVNLLKSVKLSTIYTTQSPVLSTLKRKDFDNIVGKGENAGNNVFYPIKDDIMVTNLKRKAFENFVGNVTSIFSECFLSYQSQKSSF